MAHTIAPESHVVVRRILHRCEPDLPTQHPRLGAAQPDDRMPAWPHSGQAVESGTAQEVQQHGLRLVVGRVPSEDVGREHREPRLASPGLEIGPRFH